MLLDDIQRTIEALARRIRALEVREVSGTGGGGGGTPSGTVVSETSFGQAPNAGASANYSRGDHTHGTPAAPTVPTAAGAVSSETSFGVVPNAGAAATFSRGDHTHGTPALPKLDDLASPDNNTDLNATAAAHGLMPALSGNAADVFHGDGTWGAGGGGVGDMTKAVYDPDADDQVESADYADTAGDADTVDGSHAADFAAAGHNHDADYVNVPGDTMTGLLTIDADQNTRLFDVEMTSSAPVAAEPAAIISHVSNDCPDLSGVVGLRVATEIAAVLADASPGDISNIYSIVTKVNASAAAGLKNEKIWYAFGVYATSPILTGPGSIHIQNATGLRVDNQGSASVTNARGLWIDDQTGAANNYAIYTERGINRLLDQTQIGAYADIVQLIVKGLLGQTAHLQDWVTSVGAVLADVDASGNIETTGQLRSTVAIGTAPLQVTSTTAVSNLNADMVDGKHDSDFATAAHNHKLDDLLTPDNNTDLNATTTYHGLLPRLTGSTVSFLRADGNYAIPPGSSGGAPAIVDTHMAVMGLLGWS